MTKMATSLLLRSLPAQLDSCVSLPAAACFAFHRLKFLIAPSLFHSHFQHQLILLHFRAAPWQKWVLIALAVVLLLLIKVFITPEAGVLESNGEAAATASASRASLKKMLSGVTTAPRKGVKAVLGGVGRVFGAARKKNNVPIEGEK